MTFDREKLLWVEVSLEYALNDLHNSIATCPDVHVYAEDIAECREQIDTLGTLLAEVREQLYPQGVLA